MDTYSVVIVGSGFSGIAMGVALKRAGIDTFTILEKATDVGGTWRDNTYPGAACDIPSHLYSFSFEPKPDWSRAFSPQAEIQEYLRHCATKYDLRRHIRFGATVSGAVFDESRGTWTVSLADGTSLTARALVLGNGALHVPAMPDIPGRETFQGPVFHSAQWDHDVDLRGKRVAVIGTGASAIQFVPAIAGTVGALTVFQRTAPWVIPKPDGPVPRWRQRLFRRVPALHWLHRAWLYWFLELRGIGIILRPKLMRFLERSALRHLQEVVPDAALRAKLTPRYRMGCKRILFSNEYLQALQRPHVSVVTDGIDRITPEGVVTRDGTTHPVDAIICGTGFQVHDFLVRLDVVGRRGRTLAQAMRAREGSYLGITVHGFPNLYLLMGPNTGLGHNSMIFMIEAQARYALQAIQALRRKNLRFLDVLASVQQRFDDQVQTALTRTVWSTGCQSWYAKDGHNQATWPFFTFQYWLRTRRVALGEYEAVGPARAESPRGAFPGVAPAQGTIIVMLSRFGAAIRSSAMEKSGAR